MAPVAEKEKLTAGAEADLQEKKRGFARSAERAASGCKAPPAPCQVPSVRIPGKLRAKHKGRLSEAAFVFGDPAGIRTPDPLLKRQLLCLLSY